LAIFSESSFPPNQLWDYASRLYAKENVRDVCLDLQDRHGLDVNILLFCCWNAASGRGQFTEDELTNGLERVADWRDNVIVPLRELRKYLKGNTEPAPARLAGSLRHVIVESELFSEHLEVLILSEAVDRPGTGSFDLDQQAEDGATNIAAYLKLHGCHIKARDRDQLHVIWQEAFPGASVKSAVKLKNLK
jgi:uncharacterized protein (TIGR02444 family)